MARFLFGVWPTQGHVYAGLPIANALRTAGHDVAFVTNPEFEHLLEAHEITCFPLDPLTEPGEDGTAPDNTVASFRASRIATVPTVVRSVQQATAAWQPAVLINDPAFYAPVIVGELEDRPVAALNISVCAWPGVNLAPFRSGLPPARDALTRAYYATLRALAEASYAGVVADLNATRAAFGLAPRNGPPSVVALSPYLQLVPTIPELDYERTDLPPQIHYVGPCVFDPPTALDDETAAWLARLPADRPLVLIVASTVFTRSAGLVEAALAGLAEAGLAVLATLP